jgi:hypothetical protein
LGIESDRDHSGVAAVDTYYRKILNAVKDERTAADYDETIIASPDEARAAARLAAQFMKVCGDALRVPTDRALSRTA